MLPYNKMCCFNVSIYTCRNISEEQIRWIFDDAILRSTHNISFYEDLKKTIFKLSSNIIKYMYHLICSLDKSRRRGFKRCGFSVYDTYCRSILLAISLGDFPLCCLDNVNISKHCYSLCGIVEWFQFFLRDFLSLMGFKDTCNVK